MEAVIEEHQRQALDTFGFHTAVPLFQAIGEDSDHLATGTFVAVGDKLILLTARHILCGCDPKEIAIATAPSGSTLHTLGNLVVHKPRDLPDAEFDIVAIEIQDQKTIDIIKAGWRVVNMAIGDEVHPIGEIVLIGFPSKTLTKEEMRIIGRPTSIITAQSECTPTGAMPPVNLKVDLFLQLPREAIGEGGASILIPPIGGMSGCAIWQVRHIPENELWSPDRALRLVGIQSSARSGSYFRGKRWSYIRNLLEQAT